MNNNTMADPYSLFSRSFFNVDLVANDMILTSTPCRLDIENSFTRTYDKYVRVPVNSKLSIIVSYSHRYRHPELWRKEPYAPEWLIAKVHQYGNGITADVNHHYKIPAIQAVNDEDCTAEFDLFDPFNIVRAHYTGVQDQDHGRCSDDTPAVNIPSTPEDTQPEESTQTSSLSNKSTSNGKAVMDVIEGVQRTIVVSFFKTQSPSHLGPNDMCLDVFRLHCVDFKTHLDKIRLVVQDPIARRIVRGYKIQSIQEDFLAMAHEDAREYLDSWAKATQRLIEYNEKHWTPKTSDSVPNYRPCV